MFVIALFPPLPQLSDEDDDAVVFPPISPPVVQWGERVAWRQLRHEAAPTGPPPPRRPAIRLAGTGGGVCVCMCGNVVLVHFPTIAVGHGPGTHLAGLYNRRRFSAARLFYVKPCEGWDQTQLLCRCLCRVRETCRFQSKFERSYKNNCVVWSVTYYIVGVQSNLSSSCFMTPSWLLLTWNIFSHSPEHTNTERWACVYSCCPCSSKFFIIF